MSKIMIDHREPNVLIREIAKKHEVEIKQLISADYVIYGKDTEGKEISIGIERKTKTDFLNSIIDKRIIQQMIYLKENFTAPLMIIEGTENIYELRNFHPNAIRGMLASITIDFQIPVLETRTYRDTAAFLNTIAARLEKPKKMTSLLKKRKALSLKDQQEIVIESFPLIGPSLAKELLIRFKSVKNILAATEKELQETPKIGEKKAQEMKKIIESKYEQ